MPEDSRPIYSIGAVARLLGISPGTIRAWEDRYGVISPRRSASGRRLYSRAEVERLRYVKAKIDEGIQPAEAHRLLAERADGGVEVSERAMYGGARPLVLLAERDPFAAEVMEFFLRREGYEVDVAFDVGDAERKVAARSPHLAIIELLLSGGEGAKLCRRLKERRAVPVLAVSSLEARDPSLTGGADAFLEKPLDPLEFVSTVKNLLRSSAAASVDVGA
jgi:DNA-binding transcriptional MerR regulator